MTDPRGQRMRDLQARLYAAYTERRDAGLLPVDAAREAGIRGTSTQQAYERSWREAHGLPRRAPRWADSAPG